MPLSCMLRMKNTAVEYHIRTDLNTASGLFHDCFLVESNSLCHGH